MSYYIDFQKKVNENTGYGFENYIADGGGKLEMDKGLTCKAANRILLMTTVLSIGIQFLMVFLGIRQTPLLLLGTQLSVLLVPLIGAGILQMDIRRALHLYPISWRTFIFAFLVIVCAYPTISLLNLISMFFVDNAVAGIALDIYENGYVFSMLVMALLPAIGEELLVRGMIYRSYRKKSPVRALILSALIFGMLHMNFNQMPYAVFLGILMVLMMEACDSIVAPMCMHFFMNGISTTVGYFSSDILRAQAEAGYHPEALAGSETGMMAGLLSVLTLVIATLPLAVLIIYAVFRMHHRKISEVFKKEGKDSGDERLPEVQEKEHILDIWLILALLVMVVMIVLNTLA